MKRFFSRNAPEDQNLDLSPPDKEQSGESLIVEQQLSTSLTLSVWVRERNIDFLKMEYQMTIRTKISNLNDKQASILLMVGCIEALQEGLDLTTYMSLEYLYSFLTRNYRLDPMEIKDERFRKSSLLGNLVLSSFRGEWLDLKEKIRIQEKDVYEAIKSSGWLPNKRTFNSWKATYTLDSWLEFRIVPLDHILKRSDQFEPYSSYTKSYSESAQPARQKTKHSAELDGEPWSKPVLPEIHPDEASSYDTILNAIQVSKEQRRQKEE